MAIRHSLLKGGPPSYLHLWCYDIVTQKSIEEVVAHIAKESYTELIPLNAGTVVNAINFLNIIP